MKRQALDIYDDFPKEMLAYLRNNGWHFNRKACELACKRMKKLNTSTQKPEEVETWNKDDVDALLQKHGVTIDENTGYDYVYVANMCKADYLGSSVPDEQHLALFVKDTIDDIDAGDGTTMRKWYASMIAAGLPVDWEEIL